MVNQVTVENIKSRLQLLEDLLDDLKERTQYQVNISEHSGDMRKMINMIRKDLEELK